MNNDLEQDIFKKFSEFPKEKRKEIIEIVKKYRKYTLLDFIRILINPKNEDEKQIALLGMIAKMNFEFGTDGKEHHYRVATRCGGITEHPDFYYENEQIITAMSRKDAVEKYNKLNHCNYYYGEVLGKID